MFDKSDVMLTISRIFDGCGWRRLVLLGMLAVICPARVKADETPLVLEAGKARAVVGPWGTGISISVNGVAVSTGSSMVITTPPWAPNYYLGPSAKALAGARRETIDGGVRLRISHRGDADSFIGEETISVTADGRVERVLEARFTNETRKAMIQWQIAKLNPTLLVGRQFQAEISGGAPRDGSVPIVARSSDVAASTIAKGFTSLEFDSRIGPIRIEVEAQSPLICFDYRKNRWSDPLHPILWFGDLGTRLEAGKTYRYRVVFQLPVKSAPTAAVAKPVNYSAKITPRKQAQTYALDAPPRLIPRPKEAEFGPGGYVLAPAAAGQRLMPPIDSDESTAAPLHAGAIKELHSFLVERFAFKPDTTGDETHGVCCEPPTDETFPPEGYELEVTAAGVTLRANDAPGFLHAVQTLKQLTVVTPDGDVLARAAKIRDWPSLQFRGIHLFTGGQGPDLHIKLVRDIIAAMKMNRLVLQSEYIEWESRPEIHHPQFGMPKDDVRKILATARDLDIEVIPLVMSLGHCQWMFTGGHNLELAEDPEARWAYCVTNPKTYDFIFEIYREALELFKPRCFHIGHDEYADRGRVPFRASSKPYTVQQLFMMDTQRLHKWLSGRDVKVMMWGDMLLGPGEAPDACHARTVEQAREMRAELPDGTIIADWHYAASSPAGYSSPTLFHDDGLDTVASTWYRPENIVNFAKAAHEQHSLGLLQTTWAGYSLDPDSFSKNLHQYAAYVLAADAAWNADNPPNPDTLPWEAYFLDAMGLSALQPNNRTGWTADLSAAYNYPLVARDGGGWFELGPEHDLSSVPSGEARLGGVLFDLGRDADASGPGAIVMSGKLTRDARFPQEVRLEVNRPAAQLAILHTTNFTCELGGKVGEYVITYGDGTTDAVDVVYGDNVFAYAHRKVTPGAPLVWSGNTTAGDSIALRALVWKNSHPKKPIQSLTIHSADAAGSLMVLGVTGLD